MIDNQVFFMQYSQVCFHMQGMGSIAIFTPSHFVIFAIPEAMSQLFFFLKTSYILKVHDLLNNSLTHKVCPWNSNEELIHWKKEENCQKKLLWPT